MQEGRQRRRWQGHDSRRDRERVWRMDGDELEGKSEDRRLEIGTEVATDKNGNPEIMNESGLARGSCYLYERKMYG
jgi:hypothetical protein